MKEKELLDSALEYNYQKGLDTIKDHICKLRFIAISSVNTLEEKDKEIERLKTELQDTKEHLGEYLHEQEEENNRLNNIIEKLEQENSVLKTQVVNKDKYSYGIRMGSDKE